MEELFRSYWWLLFPLSWFVIGGWNSWLNYRRSRDAMDLMRTYAAKGQEPPPDLLKTFSEPLDPDSDWDDRHSRRYGYRGRYRGPWQARLVLFVALCAGFGYAAYTDMYGAGEAFTIVAFVMGAIALSVLVGGFFRSITPKE